MGIPCKSGYISRTGNKRFDSQLLIKQIMEQNKFKQVQHLKIYHYDFI